MYLPMTGIPSFYRQNVSRPMPRTSPCRWSANCAANTFLRVGYVGTQAHHLLVVEEANPGNPALCLSLSQPADVMPGTATCGPFGESGIYTTPSGQTIQGTRGPFPAPFGGVSYQKTIGNSNYNALEVTVRHYAGPLRTAGRIHLQQVDRPVVQPGRGRESAEPGARPRALGLRSDPQLRRQLRLCRFGDGWELSGITRFSTGFPVTLFNNDDTSLLGTIPNGINNNGVDTPDYTPGALESIAIPVTASRHLIRRCSVFPRWARSAPPTRRFFYGPGIANFDMALAKNIRFAEARTLQLRLEAFNVWNHAQFYGPAAVNGNISSSNFGQIVSAAAPRLVQWRLKFSF